MADWQARTSGALWTAAQRSGQHGVEGWTGSVPAAALCAPGDPSLLACVSAKPAILCRHLLSCVYLQQLTVSQTADPKSYSCLFSHISSYAQHLAALTACSTRTGSVDSPEQLKQIEVLQPSSREEGVDAQAGGCRGCCLCLGLARTASCRA